jgi:hypothetical protein
MTLAGVRPKERVLADLEGAGLIAPDVEAQLFEVLRARLREVRATE